MVVLVHLMVLGCSCCGYAQSPGLVMLKVAQHVQRESLAGMQASPPADHVQAVTCLLGMGLPYCGPLS